jgi:hypothetical protein
MKRRSPAARLDDDAARPPRVDEILARQTAYAAKHSIERHADPIQTAAGNATAVDNDVTDSFALIATDLVYGGDASDINRGPTVSAA